jgi:ribosome maturation factor RimP
MSGDCLHADLEKLQTQIDAIAAVHGVELVALEWLMGPGRGILRVYIDRPGGDPRTPPTPEAGMTADLCVAVSRDVSAALDVSDDIELAYDLEVSSPGFERPVQKRADFDRFVGLMVTIKTRVPIGGRGSFEGIIAGTSDVPDGSFSVRLTLGDKEMQIPARSLARAKLLEIKPPKPTKPGKSFVARPERKNGPDAQRREGPKRPPTA